jgi:hypothetical protein
MPLKIPVLATVRALSMNEKIGDAATTLASQVTCPSSCVFKDGGGCYAEGGNLAGTTRSLNRAEGSQLDAARLEAKLIDGMTVYPGRPMRLHTVGDCSTGAAALEVSRAAERYMARGGGQVWTYTHAWRSVSRGVWGRVSVLASCETAQDVRDAAARGYAAALVVPKFLSRRRYGIDGVDVVPCPAQTTPTVACSSCRLCFDDAGLLNRGTAVGLAVHGSAFERKKATQALERPDDPDRRLTSRQLIPRVLAEHPEWGPRKVAQAIGVGEASAQQMMATLRREGVLPVRAAA